MSVRVYLDSSKLAFGNISEAAGTAWVRVGDTDYRYTLRHENGLYYLEFHGEQPILFHPHLKALVTRVTVFKQYSDPASVFEYGDHEFGSSTTARVTSATLGGKLSSLISIEAETVEDAQQAITAILRGKKPDYPFHKVGFWKRLRNGLRRELVDR